MTDDYPSFGDSSLFGANVYYRGTVPAAHVYGPVRGGRLGATSPPLVQPFQRLGKFLNGRACACMPAY